MGEQDHRTARVLENARNLRLFGEPGESGSRQRGRREPMNYSRGAFGLPAQAPNEQAEDERRVPHTPAWNLEVRGVDSEGWAEQTVEGHGEFGRHSRCATFIARLLAFLQAAPGRYSASGDSSENATACQDRPHEETVRALCGLGNRVSRTALIAEPQ